VILSLDVNPALEVLDLGEQDPTNQFDKCGDEPIEHFEEVADVESATRHAVSTSLRPFDLSSLIFNH
jgi:hypothetical protein